MIKLKLYPPSGTIEEGKSLKFEISGLYIDSFHINMEDATHGIRVNTKSLQSMGDGSYMGIMELGIPHDSFQSSISVFAHIEEKQEDGTYKTVQICPTIFAIKNSVSISSEKLSVSPSFIGIGDLCLIRLTGKPNSKKVVSVNGKFFRTTITKDGIGSVSFKGADVIDKDINSVYQLPIYLYSEEDNFAKKVFSNSYLNILPSSISMHAIDPRCDPNDTENYIDPTGAWVQPTECIEDPEEPDVDSLAPTIPPNALPDTCREEKVNISDDNICKIFNHSATLLNNGMVVHAYLSPDITYNDSDDERFNINKVFIAKQQTTLDIQVIANRDVVIEPKLAGELFRIHVQNDLWVLFSDLDNPSAAVASDIYVVLFNESIGFQRIKIVGRVIEDYSGYIDSNILLGEMEGDALNINDWLFCVNAVFYHASESPGLYIWPNGYNSFPYIRDDDDNYLQITNVSIASNSKYIGDNEESYIYVIAEALNGVNSQLFFASLTVGKNNSINREMTSWVQITNNGNNQHPIAKAGSDNNLHIIWESDRAGIKQVYYGVIGLSLVSSACVAFSSCIDKYSEFLSKSDIPFDYLSANLLVDAEGTVDDPIPEYNSENLVSSSWDTYSGNGGIISQNGSTNHIDNLTITANAVQDYAIAFNNLQIVAGDDDPSAVNPSYPFSYSQFNYQIAFNLSATVQQKSYLASTYNGVVINDKTIDNLFDIWKNEFELSFSNNVNNQPVYTKNGNSFVIGRIDNVFDRIVPFMGSYDRANPSANQFQIDITDQSNNLKDFTFGLMFEKTIFTATSLITGENPSTANPEIHVIYTGMAKLIALIKTEDVESDRSNYIIVREFPEKINVIENKAYTIIANYTKLDSEEVTTLLDTYDQTYSDKFLGQITLLIDGVSRFSQSFISTASDIYNDFDIGFGIPYGGYYVADKMSPSKLGVFDSIESTLVFTDIFITSPTYTYNTDIINLPSNVRNMTKLMVNDSDLSLNNYSNLLNMGLREGDNNLTQIPLTFEGVNQSPNMTLGACNDVHAVWQSNRDRYWNIFYSNSVNKLSPFRFNTQITDTESNSLKPSIAVSRNRSRLVTWHDNRNGNFNIFIARSTEGYTCDQDKCSKEMANAFESNIVECNISISYASVVGIYDLVLEFYKDAALTDLYKTISINEDTEERWFIDNSAITSLLSYDDDEEIQGLIFSAESIVTISYTPDKDDDIFDKILYIKLTSTEVTG